MQMLNIKNNEDLSMETRLLVVDDESAIRTLLSRILTRQGYQVIEAANGTEALDVLQTEPSLRIILTDLRMPVCGGIEFIANATERFQRQFEFIVLTGDGDKHDAIQAMRLGAREFLDKPVTRQELTCAVSSAHQRLQQRDREIERLRSSEMTRLQQASQLDDSDEQLVSRLATVAQYRDVETAEHCIRVGRGAAHLAHLAGYDTAFQHQLELGAILHDIGKIGIPDAILFKEGRLSETEFQVMETHTEIGYRMLSGSANPVIQLAADIARYHHERWDGSGYTLGLEGEAIPLAARIVSIIDVYDALRSKRRYKEAFSHERAVSIITEGDGRTAPSHFEPELLALFRNHHRDFENLYRELPDKEI
ncbi:HD-GYP domain-containing protein [Motiliproteus sediminis]|uniref:HD-GYP domain-containing protein n=1 Tax=Motiliproteus sediminis TaxID=1468178 RepID=UPI001AEFD0A3|nr:HD domain-containing phosphohydrolase [Motiliproteus sediminis]